MDRDPALMKKRKKIMGHWDVGVAFAYAICVAATYCICFVVWQAFISQGIAVVLTALGVVLSLSVGCLKWITKVNKEMKSDISTGDRFISGPHKELASAYAAVDHQIAERWKELREEHPIVFISSLSYYPSYEKRRHVVAASVVMTLRR